MDMLYKEQKRTTYILHGFAPCCDKFAKLMDDENTKQNQSDETTPKHDPAQEEAGYTIRLRDDDDDFYGVFSSVYVMRYCPFCGKKIERVVLGD